MLPSTSTFNILALLGVLGTKGKALSFPKNRIIFSQGDSSDAIFYVEFGNVKHRNLPGGEGSDCCCLRCRRIFW